MNTYASPSKSFKKAAAVSRDPKNISRKVSQRKEDDSFNAQIGNAESERLREKPLRLGNMMANIRASSPGSNTANSNTSLVSATSFKATSGHALSTGRAIQRKLTIGRPNDLYKQQGDRVTSQVKQQINAPASTQSSQGQSVQRQEATGDLSSAIANVRLSATQGDRKTLRRNRTQETSSALIQVKQAETTNNTGLPDLLKTGIEHLSGYSMDDVKVHYNSDKPAQLQAHAYAQGTDIHIAPGQEKHLPHEGWHVVQQMQGRVRTTTQERGVMINDDHALEREADLMGEKAASIKIGKGYPKTNQVTQKQNRESTFQFSDDLPKAIEQTKKQIETRLRESILMKGNANKRSVQLASVQNMQSSERSVMNTEGNLMRPTNTKNVNVDSRVIQRQIRLHRGYTLARARDAVNNKGSLDPVGAGEFGKGLYFWEDNPKAALISAVAYYGNKDWAVIEVSIPNDVYDEHITRQLEFPSIVEQIAEDEDLGTPSNKPSVDMAVTMLGSTSNIKLKMWVEEFRRMNQIAGDEAFVQGGANDNTSWNYDAIKGPSAAQYNDYSLNQIKYERVDLFQDPQVTVQIVAQGPPIDNYRRFKMSDKNDRYTQLRNTEKVTIQFKKKKRPDLAKPSASQLKTPVVQLKVSKDSRKNIIQFSGEYKKLEAQKKVAIDEESEERYYKAITAFEKYLGWYAARHPKSIAAASDMLSVIVELAQPRIEKALLSIPEVFGTTDPGTTGGVGMDADKITEVLREGNFREKMTLIYNSYCNRKLSPLISTAIWGNPDPKSLFSRPESIMKDRQERKNVEDKSATLTTETVDSVQNPPLSDREREFSVVDDRLQWVSGMRRIYYEEHSEYIKEAKRLKVLAGGGISGTAYAIIEIAMILGISDLNNARLAALGWMLPAHDHTFYEIMQASTEMGLEYVPGPLGYHFIDPLDTSEIERNVLVESEGKFPDYFLSDVYKDKLAKG
ncbi:DUF4157 domain-containing protein [Pleurocapsa sp. PCC 7319]|uniref:eCIS core domain-containing protein n=1 Tax=Pleurocapsa sp. PCC 7319 TaxID=118161 RepID=UPI000349F043|nr:DUF4157 domain-containing protein [Pleurocapsa sp. PCC 7319]